MATTKRAKKKPDGPAWRKRGTDPEAWVSDEVSSWSSWIGARSEAEAEAFCSKRIELFRSSGNYAALLDALALGEKHGCRANELLRICRLLIWSLADGVPAATARGIRVLPPAAWWKRHDRDLEDQWRALLVAEGRDRLHLTWAEAAEQAADMMGSEGARVSPAAMLASYKRVRRNERRTPGRYYSSSREWNDRISKHGKMSAAKLAALRRWQEVVDARGGPAR